MNALIRFVAFIVWVGFWQAVQVRVSVSLA